MSFSPDPAEGKRVYDLDREYVFHSWSAQGSLNPMCIAATEGSYVWDYDGNKWLDFSSQLVNVNIGHQHPKIVAAIQEQAAKISTIAPQHANDKRGEAAQRIVELAGPNIAKVFFTNGGADAVENAIRMARLHTHKHKVLSTYRSYHGNTGAAITATGDPRRWPNEYASQHVHFFGPYPYRSPFWSDSPEQETERALQHLEQVIQFEGPNTVGAIILESVVGTAGILVPPPGYLEGVRALADKYEIVWIADETMSGFARTGKWFAFQNWEAQPDLIVFAKGSNSGYVPVGGVVISADIAATFDERVFPGGLTYSGHPLACATAVASINIFDDEGVNEHARHLGKDVIGWELCEMASRHPSIGEVRGLGVFWAVELVRGHDTREPMDAATMGAVVAECKANGMWPMMAANRIHVVPPCTTPDDVAREGLAILDAALAIADDAVA